MLLFNDLRFGTPPPPNFMLFMILFGYEQVAKRIANIRLTDSGVVGLDAAKEFFGQLKTLSEADAEWK